MSRSLNSNDASRRHPVRRHPVRRLLPLGVLVLGIVLVFATGLDRQLGFDAIARQYDGLQSFVAVHPVLAPLVALAIYAAATALAVPAAWILTVAAALVFGWLPGALLVVCGATLGACALYVVARSALAGFFTARAGNVLNAMARGFREDAAGYLLFLRLAPVFPFTLVNVVPGILGVPFLTFAWTTLIGIIPGTIAYSLAGEGLRSIIGERATACAANIPPCGTPLGPGDLVTPQILVAFGVLGVVSLIPVVLKRWRRAKAGEPHQ